MKLLLVTYGDIAHSYQRSLFPTTRNHVVYYWGFISDTRRSMQYDAYTEWGRKGIFLKKR